MEQVQTSTRRIVKKITAKIVAGKVSLEKLIAHNNAHPGEVMPLFGIIGLASDFSTGSSDFGQYVKLLGQFKAVNHDTGEEFRSGAAILPGAASDLIFGALRGLGEGGGSIEFALRIGVRRDDTSATGYVYVVEQRYQPKQQDALGALEDRLSGANVQSITDQSQSMPKAEAVAEAIGEKAPAPVPPAQPQRARR